MSPLIGRDGDVARVEQLLFGPAPVPILTITGPSGIGKTRFVREVVDRAALGRPEPKRDTRPGGDHTLLVVDEPDLTVSRARDLTSCTLQRRPGAQVIVTSLAPLRMPGERAYRLERLSPEPDGVALFLAAVAPRRRVELDPAQIAALCVELSGLPLAVQAAAALADAVPPEHLLRRLGEARLLDVLGDVQLPGDRTLRGAITRTYSELPDDDRRLLAALSVLPPQFTTAAAVAVLGRSEGAVLAGLARLTAVGALTRSDAGSSAVSGDLRFAVPRAMREMSRESMSPPRGAPAAVAHHYRAIAATAAVRSLAGDDLRALGALRGEEKALQTSADQLAEGGDSVGALVVEVAGAMASLSLRWDPDAAPRLDARRRAARDAATPALRLHAQLRSARLAVAHAVDLPAPGGPLLGALVDGVAAAHAHGDPALIALAVGFAVEGAADSGDAALCQRLIRPALELDAEPSVRAPLDAWSAVLESMHGHGSAAVDAMEAAREQVQDAASSRALLAAAVRLTARLPDPSGPLGLPRLLADARRLGDRHLEVRVLTHVARAALDRGEIPDALSGATEALKLAQASGGAGAAGATVGALAVVAECATASDELYEAVRLQDALAGIAPRAAAVSFARSGDHTGRRRNALSQADAARALHEASAWSLVDAVGHAQTAAAALSAGTVAVASFSTSTLTRRERDVLIQLAAGASNKAIGDALGLTPKTVMHHSQAIYRKLGVHTRAEAAVVAVRQGLVPADH